MSNRRKFIKQSTLSTAGLAFGTEVFSAPYSQKVLGSNDKIRVGFIGLGNRGSQLLSWFMQNDDVEIAAFCDVYEPYISRDRSLVSKKYLEMGKVPKMNEPSISNVKQYKDYRELLAQKDIDAVCIATPDHWHALQTIHAFQAGKHVYVEKPLVGIDLGFRDETAGLMISVDQDKMEAYVKLVLFGSGLTQDDIIAALVPYQSYKMVLDSARPEIIEAMKRQRFKAVPSKKGAGSVLDGIQLMTSYDIIIDPQNSDKVIDAFTNYVWKTTATEVPNHAYSHIPDSIRYGLSYVCGGNSGTYYLDGETYGGRIDTSDMARTWH